MALDIFLALSGIQGNSRDIDHPGWFEVLSCHSSIDRRVGSNDTSFVCLQDVTLERHVDNASQTLKEASGRHFESAAIDVVMRGASDGRLTYPLGDCMLTSYKKLDEKTETLSINFAQIEWRWWDDEGKESSTAAFDIREGGMASSNEIDVFGRSRERAYETASDRFLRIPGVNGTSSDPGHIGWHDVLSHSLNLLHEGGTEHWSYDQSLVITKRPDRTFPELANACATGVRFDSVTLEVVSLRNRRTLMIYNLSDCMITSFQAGQTANETPLDRLGIGFKHMDWEYFPPADTAGRAISKGRVKQGDVSVPSKAVIVPKSAFIIMWMDPEHPELEDVHAALVEVCDHFGVSAVRADDIQHDDRITDIILDRIRTSEIVIADLTGERPNVYYEVGHAHAMGKQPILIRKKGSPLHFDLAVHNVREYKNLTELRAILTKRLSSVYS